MSVKDHIIGANGEQYEADFMYMRSSEAWYKVRETGFMFPVPFDDMDGGTFGPLHKAVVLMRWIRKAYYAQADA